MPETCPRGFDETLLTGALDGELVQVNAQKVRVHLEDCEHCRTVFAELARNREVAMTTTIRPPDDDQWRETPRGTTSLFGWGLGWLLLAIWVVVISAYGLYRGWTETEGALMKFLVFGGIGGVVLLFGSVALDRVKTAKTDPYKGVEK